MHSPQCIAFNQNTFLIRQCACGGEPRSLIAAKNAALLLRLDYPTAGAREGGGVKGGEQSKGKDKREGTHTTTLDTDRAPNEEL